MFAPAWKIKSDIKKAHLKWVQKLAQKSEEEKNIFLVAMLQVVGSLLLKNLALVAE